MTICSINYKNDLLLKIFVFKHNKKTSKTPKIMEQGIIQIIFYFFE